MIDVHIRWLIRRDIDDVLRIDACDGAGWDRDDLFRFKLIRQNSAMVAEFDDQVVGWMLYTCHPQSLTLVHLGVSPRYRHCGIGRQMLEFLQSKLDQSRRASILTDVPESWLGGQKFLRSCGWRATKVLRGQYGSEDAYRFTWSVEATPRVRITGGECGGR